MLPSSFAEFFLPLEVALDAERCGFGQRGARNTRNANDGIYNSPSSTDKTALTLQTSKTASGYAGVINLGVAVG